MKKLLLIAMLCFSTAAFAADKAPAKTPAAAHATAPAASGTENKEAMKGEKFEEHKAKVLKHIGERIAKMQEKQACAQAAATPEAMKACFPNWGKHRGEWHGKHEGNDHGQSGHEEHGDDDHDMDEGSEH